MRHVYLALLLILAAVYFMFKFQSLDTVTVQFLSASLTLPLSVLPLSVLLLIVFVPGVFTGGVVMSLVRSWLQAATIKALVRS